jgi:hypothetical protein
MRRLVFGTVISVLLLLATAAPAAASSTPGGVSRPAADDVVEAETHDVVPVATWTFAGILAGAVVLGTLYLFKRRIGAFPKNPSWVAPITILPSNENAESFGDAPAGDHGHH